MQQTASGYHHLTSYESDRMQGGGLDWTNLPHTYKFYEGHNSIPLSREFEFPKISLRSLYACQIEGATCAESLAAVQLSTVLFLAYGLTARRQAIGEDFFFRSVPSAGALYPAEIYVGAWNMEGVPTGLYHFDTTRHVLVPLRSGDFRHTLGPISNDIPISDKSLTFYVSGIFFRSSWKYRKRAYRYVLLDAGHLIENLVLALGVYRLTPAVSLDFNDEEALLLMGFDPAKEVCLAEIPLTGKEAPTKRKPPPLSPLGPEVADASIVSARETTFPEILDIHISSSTIRLGARPQGPMMDAFGIKISSWDSLPQPKAEAAGSTFAQSVLNRRSHRNFIPMELKKEVFASLIDLVASAAAGHRALPPYEGVLACGFFANTVEGLVPGFYLIDAEHRTFGQVQAGIFANQIVSVCLDQEWLKNASLHFLFMTHLRLLDELWGARGYRYAMVAAGRLGQAVYLACTTLGLGCCGIGAFYDGEARKLLGLDPDAALLYLVAAGNIRRFP